MKKLIFSITLTIMSLFSIAQNSFTVTSEEASICLANYFYGGPEYAIIPKTLNHGGTFTIDGDNSHYGSSPLGDWNVYPVGLGAPNFPVTVNTSIYYYTEFDADFQLTIWSVDGLGLPDRYCWINVTVKYPLGIEDNLLNISDDIRVIYDITGRFLTNDINTLENGLYIVQTLNNSKVINFVKK